MAIAMTLKEFLEQEGVEYEVLKHPHSHCASKAAEAAHIPGDQVAKCVLLEDEGGYVMAVIPATHRVQIGRLHKQLHRNLGLATEHELDLLFDDCEVGAIPPLGQAYGIEVVVDDSLGENSDIYFEGGDHTSLIHMTSKDFKDLMKTVQHGTFSRHV
jgi:Ala-tRNA(Pro) deacylase